MGIEPGMSDPDWDRYLVKGKGGAPVGDPTRWGAMVETIIPATGLADSTQVLAAATRDPYARSWALLGTLSLTPQMWNAFLTGTAGVVVSLDVAMGVGQAVVTHRIALAQSLPAAGLCFTQYFEQGGPYFAINAPPAQTRAFAIIGGLVGQSINIRANYNISGGFALPFTSQLTVALTPFAAGQGL